MEADFPASRKRRTRKEINELLHLYELSGLSVAAFCKQYDLHPNTVHKWLRNYSFTDSGTKPRSPGSFSTLSMSTTPEPALFAQVGDVRLYQPVSAAYLKELLS